jgi:cytochrome P450
VTSPERAVLEYPFSVERALEVEPAYLELHERGPIRVQLPFGEPCWLATRYEDVRTVHGDRRFVKEMGVGRDVPTVHARPPLDPSMLAMMDPPRHTRIRKLTSAAFAKPRMRALSGWIGGYIDELLDRMVREAVTGDGVADFMPFSWDLPNHVVTGILGVPTEDASKFRGWIDTMTSPASTLEQRYENNTQLERYIRELIAARRMAPTGDVLGELVLARDDDDRLTEDELVMLSMSLFFGGFETTVAQLGATMYTLLADRRYWEELVDDRDLLPAAMEELWRWVPTFRYGFPHVRWAAEDVELSGGVIIPAGEAVLPERTLGHRDEAVFNQAQTLDFHREDPAPHLTLGWGPHHCVGAHLAQLEIELSLRAVLERFPTMELAVASDDVPWSMSIMLRSPAVLPVRW